MADLGVAIRPGVVVVVGSSLGVNVDGATYSTPWWPATYIPAVGDPVRVLLCAGEASILGPTIPGVRAATGTVAGSPINGLLPVTIGSDTVQCRYIGTAPGSGTLVLLSWQATTPWVIAAAAAYVPPVIPPPLPPPPAPPPVTTSGTLTVSAVDSGSYTNMWALPDVRQGAYGSYTYLGAWFYGAGPAQLAGATITGFRIRFGARLAIGSYNSPMTAHVYRVVQMGKTSAPSYADGPFDETLAANAPAQWMTLAPSMGQHLVDAGGGGMGLSGTGYGGVAGINTDPASGQIQLDWVR